MTRRRLAVLLLAALAAPARAQDSDADGMSDAAELAAARELAPLLVWSPLERCADHELFYQVRPAGEGRLRAVYVLTFPVDCGFPALGLGAHPGDTQELKVDAVLEGGRWRAERAYVPMNPPLDVRGPLSIWVSAGKHHLYTSQAGCRKGAKGLLERCGGGAAFRARVTPERNVGEQGHPLVTTLGDFRRGPWRRGYWAETAWGDSAWGDGRFCGGRADRNKPRRWLNRLKRRVAWGECGDALGRKWER